MKPQNNNNKNNQRKSTNLPKVVYNSNELSLVAGRAHNLAYENIDDQKKYWYYMGWHNAFLAAKYNSENNQYDWHACMRRTNNCLEYMREALIKEFEKNLPKINRGNF